MRTGRDIGRWSGAARFFSWGRRTRPRATGPCQAVVAPDGSRSALLRLRLQTDGKARANSWFFKSCACAYGQESILSVLAARKI
ncbi:hypothetical protein [Candidatus Methylacidithermus pantelleriae]|uniref:hypothetical protein n=1 Tax=Candidatus Methylacidithermus pantelleriae TaxID=2744239 RepID=UPI00157D7FB9|nr:hypothetical protein [Candidatus Methylacidithermus pantelleriae]